MDVTGADRDDISPQMKNARWELAFGLALFYPWVTAGFYFIGWPKWFYDIGMLCFVVLMSMYVIVRLGLAIIWMHGSDAPKAGPVLNDHDVVSVIRDQPTKWHSAGEIPGTEMGFHT